jgi:BON domain
MHHNESPVLSIIRPKKRVCRPRRKGKPRRAKMRCRARTRLPAFGLAGIAFGALAALGTILGQAAIGGDPPSPPELPPIRIESVALGATALDDCRLSLLARQELYKDDRLGDLPLGATVRGDVAFVWGTVPSAELARLAEERIRKVRGVDRVQNEVLIDTSLKPAHSAAGIASAPVEVPQITQGTLTDGGRTSITARLVDQSPDKFRDSIPSGTLKSAGAPVVILPPISLSSARETPPTTPGASLMLPTPVPREVAGLAGSVEELRSQHPTLRSLHIEVHGRIVRLSGAASNWEDVLSLAQGISRVPGVERVILESIRTSGPHPLAIR